MNKSRGFTLVEIMIVVGIIGLLAAIAIPNLVRARMSTYENVAVASLKTITSAMECWAAQHNSDYTGASLNTLANATPSYIDSVLGTGYRSGYDFSIVLDGAMADGKVHGYNALAKPARYKNSGERSFISDEGGVIYARDNAGAYLTDADKVGANVFEQ